MKKLCTGDPALVKVKHSRYKLTRSGPLAGFSFAKAVSFFLLKYVARESTHLPVSYLDAPVVP